MKREFLLGALIIFSFFINNGSFLYSEVRTMDIPLENAIVIVKKELVKEKDVKRYEILADEKNSIWNSNFLSNDNFKKSNPVIIKKLEQKNYWAIQCIYKDRTDMLGGEKWFFIDKKTGEVILFFSLK